MAKFAGFTVPDGKRIARATRIVEGTPRTYVHVPQQIRQPGASGGSTSPSTSTGTPWTIAEYDAETGDRIATFDRGKRRDTGTTLRDLQVQFVADSDGNWLYAAGSGSINRDYGTLVKWNADTGEKVWESDRNGNSGPIHALGNVGDTCTTMCVADDGFIWVLGSDSSNACAGRFNPDTGVQTGKYAIALTTTQVNSINALTGGKVLITTAVAIGGTKFAVVLDDTCAETASSSLLIEAYAIDTANSRIATSRTGSLTNSLRLLDFSLTALDQRTPPGSEAYGALALNSGNLFATTTGGANPMLRAYDVTNLATENWNYTRDASSESATPRSLQYVNSALYTFGTHNRKLSASNGAEQWETGTDGQAAIPSTRLGCAVGSDFVMSIVHSTKDIWCYNDSDGSVRWYDDWSDDARFIHVTADDRVFVGGFRIGP